MVWALGETLITHCRGSVGVPSTPNRTECKGHSEPTGAIPLNYTLDLSMYLHYVSYIYL